MLPLQVLTLIACAVNVCSAGEKKVLKKCPPEELDLQPLHFKSIEDYHKLFGNWRLRRCLPGVFCDDLDCMDFTYGRGDSDKELINAASAYNQSSTKVWAFDGIFSLLEPSGFRLNGSDKRANGKFYLLALTKRAYFFVACFDDNSFAGWICTKAKTYEVCDLLEMKGKVEEIGLKWNDFRKLPNKDCEKKKEGFR